MFCFRLQSKHTDVTKSDRAKKKVFADFLNDLIQIYFTPF